MNTLAAPTSTVAIVHIRLGPLPSKSVNAWVGYARRVLAAVPTAPGGEGVWLPADVISGFERYLDEWSRAAERTDPFTWEGEVPREEAEYLFHAFFRMATHLSTTAQATGPQAPAESEAFYHALVAGLLTALDREGDATSEFSEHLRAFWPGLEA
jgi:hypothetical protein